jgi:hypothetical protein
MFPTVLRLLRYRDTFSALIVGISFCAAAASAAEEEAASLRIAEVDLFKNGLAVVRAEVPTDGPGTYVVSDVPEPVHGTFWCEGATARFATRRVEVDGVPSSALDLASALAGKDVALTIRSNRLTSVGVQQQVTIQGKVLAPSQEERWSRQYERPAHRYYYWHAPATTAVPMSEPQRMIALRTNEGVTYIDVATIVSVHVPDGNGKVRRDKPVLLLERTEGAEGDAPVRLRYMSKGLSWAPSYSLELASDGSFSIRQKAVIRNEMTPLTGTTIRLISGYPNVKFSHVVSPLSPTTTWAGFFNQLGQRVAQAGNALGQAVAQQVAFNNPRPQPSTPDVSARIDGEGVDLHYHEIGRHTLGNGEAVSIPLKKAQGKYERIVEWSIPDTRQPNGRPVQDYHRQRDPEKYQDAAWDAVRFANPFDYPMTTGATTILDNGRFAGQTMTSWVSPGEKTIARVTKAMRIRTVATESEESGKREVVYVGGDDYHSVAVKGQLLVGNQRAEKIHLLIRREFSGKLKEADLDPKVRLREEGVYSVNERNELLWDLELEPGEQRTITYRYRVLINR